MSEVSRVSKESISYTIPGRSRSKLGFILSVLIVLGTALEILLTKSAPLGLFVLFGLFFYFTSISTTTLSEDQLSVKPILGRVRTFPLKTGIFTLKKSESWATKLSTLKSSADTLIYTPAGGDPVMVMNGLYDSADIEKLYQEIGQRQAALLSQES